MPCHRMQYVQSVGPNLFVHNENSASIMPRVAAHAVMSCAHHREHAHWQDGCPMKMWHARNYLWTCHLQQPTYI